jgi:glycosyltransferase involved in cell wall biosynthesis
MRWLIIAHEATNSGSPRMLLEVLRGISARRGSSWSCEILVAGPGASGGGSLQQDFTEVGRVQTLLPPRLAGASRWLRAADRLLLQRPRLARLRRQWMADGVDLVYANSATTGRILSQLRSLRCPTVTHVHELAPALRRFNTPQALSTVLTRSDHFFAVSRAVVEDLMTLGVSAERITRIPNFISRLPTLPDVSAARARVRVRLGRPEATPFRVVLGCGHIDPIKGPDRFVELARTLAPRFRDVVFVWLGGEIDTAFAAKVRAAAQAGGGGSIVQFVGAVADPQDFFAASDVITVMSRLESFSRVALEAGALGRPVFAFASARGPVDLLPEAGLVAGDTVDEMAVAVAECLSHPAAGARLGSELRERIGAEFIADKWIPAILATVEGLKHDR